jgi:hypothetical protein
MVSVMVTVLGLATGFAAGFETVTGLGLAEQID